MDVDNYPLPCCGNGRLWGEDGEWRVVDFIIYKRCCGPGQSIVWCVGPNVPCVMWAGH